MVYSTIYGITTVKEDHLSNRNTALALIKDRVFQRVIGAGIGTYDSVETYENNNKYLHEADRPAGEAIVGHDPTEEFAKIMKNNTQLEIIEPEQSGVNGSNEKHAVKSPHRPVNQVPDVEQLEKLVKKAESVQKVIEKTSEDAITEGALLYRDIGKRIKIARREDTIVDLKCVWQKLERNTITDNIVTTPIDSPTGKLLLEDAWVNHQHTLARRINFQKSDGGGQPEHPTLPYKATMDKLNGGLPTTDTRIFTDGNGLPPTITTEEERKRLVETASQDDIEIWIAPGTAHQ